MSLEFNQHVAFDAVGFDLGFTADFRQVDDKRCTDDLAAGLTHQLDRRFRGAACRNEIVNDEDALALLDGILVDLDGINAVFKRVVLSNGLARQLTLFADRYETAAKPVGDRAAKYEAARLDTGDRIDMLRTEGPGHRDDRQFKAFGIAK